MDQTTKQDLRRRMKALRDAMPEDAVAEGSRRIADRVAGIADGCFFVYVSVGHEVETHGLIERLLAAGRTVCVPLMVETGGALTMQAHRIESLGDLRSGRMGIPEPPVRRPWFAPDVAVVPALAVTAAGARLGRGGGHYDRYLAAHRDCLSVAVVFDEQVVEALPVESHDVAVRRVITPTHMYRCGG